MTKSPKDSRLRAQDLPVKESALQETVAALLRFQARRGVIWFSIPNELPASEKRAARFARMGMKRGVADILVVIHGVAHFLELKTKKGRQSQDQKAFELECELSGVHYRLARSFDEARAILEEWGCFG